MSANSYEIRQCPNCGLRYPLTTDHSFGERCPSCLGETQVVLERTIHLQLQEERPGMNRETHLSILLDNIRSAWNVGSIFRTADGLGISKLYLCGITPTPENTSVPKTALGAEKSVSWEYANNALETARNLKGEGYKLIALEQDNRARSIMEIEQTPVRKAILVIGNEVTGVDPDILDLSDEIVHIPMHGQKRSLNVEVALGIAAFQFISTQIKD